jgi:hypothetical protein
MTDGMLTLDQGTAILVDKDRENGIMICTKPLIAQEVSHAQL